MSLKSNQRHLMGAIGYLMGALLAITSLMLASSYSVGTVAVIVISLFSIASTCLVLIYFFCTAVTTKVYADKSGRWIWSAYFDDAAPTDGGYCSCHFSYRSHCRNHGRYTPCREIYDVFPAGFNYRFSLQ